MSDLFHLQGSYSAEPGMGAPSADPVIAAPLDETLVLGRKHPDQYDLADDTPVSVDFGGVTQAHVVVIKTVGGKITVRITTADGTSQSVPVDSLLILMSKSAPVTALTLVRPTGQPTKVKLFLGQRA